MNGIKLFPGNRYKQFSQKGEKLHCCSRRQHVPFYTRHPDHLPSWLDYIFLASLIGGGWCSPKLKVQSKSMFPVHCPDNLVNTALTHSERQACPWAACDLGEAGDRPLGDTACESCWPLKGGAWNKQARKSSSAPVSVETESEQEPDWSGPWGEVPWAPCSGEALNVRAICM